MRSLSASTETVEWYQTLLVSEAVARDEGWNREDDGPQPERRELTPQGNGVRDPLLRRHAVSETEGGVSVKCKDPELEELACRWSPAQRTRTARKLALWIEQLIDTARRMEKHGVPRVPCRA